MVKTESVSLVVSEVVSAPRFQLLPSEVGFIKIRLMFTTSEPKHVRSQMMQQIYHSKPPFIEDVCVLMPSAAVFTLLETFFPAFEWLKEIGVVSPTANLQEFKVLDEDTHTLAFLFK